MKEGKINFATAEAEEYTIVKFSFKDIIEPDTLTSIDPPKVEPTKGVIISGRGPIWLYCNLVHYYHPTKFIATHDPRLGGAVIIESHSRAHTVGTVIREVDL
jgi:CRISPR-associated protein Csx3